MSNGLKKPRRPRWPAKNMSALNLLDNVRDFSEEEAAQLANAARMGWHRLTTGSGTQSDYDDVGIALNITAVLCQPIGEEAFAVVEQAQHALVEMRSRYDRLGRFGASAAEMRDVPAGLDLHDQLLKLINPLQYAKAIGECRVNILARNVIDPVHPAAPVGAAA